MDDAKQALRFGISGQQRQEMVDLLRRLGAPADEVPQVADWLAAVRAGHKAITVRDYRVAREKYEDAFKRLIGAVEDLAAIQRALEEPSSMADAAVGAYNLGCCYALDNRPEDALVALHRAVDFGYVNLSHMERDADLERARTLPGWAALTGRLKGPTYLGVQTRETREGLVVASVVAGSPAQDVSLEAGDVLTQVDGHRTTRAHIFSWFIRRKKPGDSICLVLTRKGQSVTVETRLATRRQ